MTGEYAEKLLNEKLEGLRSEIWQAETRKKEFESEKGKYQAELSKLSSEIEAKRESIKKLNVQEKSLQDSCESIEKDQASAHQKRKEELAKITTDQLDRIGSIEKKQNEINRTAHNLDSQKDGIKSKITELKNSIDLLIEESFKKLDAIHPDQ